MKKINILFFCLALCTACNDDFLTVDPVDRYSDPAVWSDPVLITSYVNNVYMGLHYGFQALMLSSLCDESTDTWQWETQPVVNGGINPSYLGALGPGFWITSFKNLTWNSLYKNIRACNLFFENIEKYEMTGDDIERLKGEVHFLRGYFYYWLMSFYGGIPLIDRAYTLTDNFLVPRNTLEETVNFIVADCDAAANLLPSTGDKARATKGAAMTLKSRVLLYAASDLFNSNASWTSGYEHPELVSYVGGNRTARWRAAQDAAKAVIDLNLYDLYGNPSPARPEEATENYVNIFLNHSNAEDIFLSYYDNETDKDWQSPSPGLFNGPNGFHNWGGNSPTEQFVDAFEMIDGSKFDWNNEEHKADPYKNRDPRFYATVLYNGAYWRQRPDDVVADDPEGIVQTGYYENADGSLTPGLDTRGSRIEDWNGSYTGYYVRKFLDPAINHQYDKQKLPWRQMRYAEVLLNYVEASLELGDNEIARTCLNKIRSRAGMSAIPAEVTDNALMDHYRYERRIELAYEQHRYFDIRRWMIAPDVVKNAQGIYILYPYGSRLPIYSITEVFNRKWVNSAYFLPILLDEMNRNAELVQNPEY